MAKNRSNETQRDETKPGDPEAEIQAGAATDSGAVTESDEVPYVPPIVNPTPNKPTLEFLVQSGNTSVTGFFIDESAAIAHFVATHGPTGAFQPQVTCLTSPRFAKVYEAAE